MLDIKKGYNMYTKEDLLKLYNTDLAELLSKSQKYFIQRQKELGDMNGYIEEIYSGHNVVKVYNGTKESFAYFDKLNEKLYIANRKSQFLSGLMHPIMGFIGNFGYVMVCIVGALLTINNIISFGVIVAFMIYVRMFTNPLNQIAQAMSSLQSTAAASERVFEFLEEEEEQQVIDNPVSLEGLKGAVESFFETDGMVEAAFMKDVVAAIDSIYRTIPDKEHRAIAGLSIGAMQSMYISANAPDSFGYVGLYSSMLHPVLRKSEHSSFYKGLKRKLEAQFVSPPEVYSIMIGKTDIYYPRMKSYARYLQRKGYPFEMYITGGGHQWYNWEKFANIFMQKLWHNDRN